ncbi:hypothetical protein BG015_009738 [Linnemannia schmuckeri]|uniref:Uncharacterized protein n=1 Tax=Linnemannia schmuckeri TaxID=64567 RepID=A0A9P5RXI7_9FUNG|nr:hypothetical protein BG015_009738 [Linnemannia schmuckeri]
MDRRSHNGRYNTNRISISSSSGGGGSGSGNGSETAVSATSIRPLDLPILDSLEMLTLLGPLQDSLSYLLLNRIPMLRTLWIAFGDSTVPTFFPSSCDDNNSNNNNSLPQTLRDGCPNLVDLIVEGSISDNHLAWMLAKASARGWRTLIFKSENNILGLESVYAILEHAASTLETIRFGNSGPSFQSHHVQELLCTASNLVRFVGLVGDRTEEKDVELKVEEVFGGGPGGRRNLKNENWACLALEEFRCKITGIPRPDVKTRTNGRPLTDHPLHSDTLYTLEDSYRIQRQVYTQLGRLYKLKYLSLGSDCFYTDKSRYDIDKFLRAEREREGQYYSTTFVQAGFQDECLSMTLASGLELMGGLKELRMLEVSGMRIAGEFWEESEEKKWIKTAWPKVELVCSSGSRRECGAYWKQFGY